MMSKNGFSRCGELYIGRLRKEGRYSTAHVYQNALLSFTKFCGGYSVSFRQVTRERLRRYEQHLYECGLKPNTISTYMRMLRSVYNRGVEAGSAPYVPYLFRDVYTGVDVRQKRALPMSELHKLLYDDPQSERLRRTQSIATLMFQFCGMSFADLAHLENRLWTVVCCAIIVSKRRLLSVLRYWIVLRRCWTSFGTGRSPVRIARIICSGFFAVIKNGKMSVLIVNISLLSGSSIIA